MKQLSIQNQNFKLEDMFIVISLKTWYLFIFIYLFIFFLLFMVLFNFSLLPFG